MLKLVFYVALFIYLLYLIKRVFFPSRRLGGLSTDREGREEEMVKDPVCQTYIPRRDAVSKRIGGKTYYFCGRDCADAFRRSKGDDKG